MTVEQPEKPRSKRSAKMMRIAVCTLVALVAVNAAPMAQLSDSEYQYLFEAFQKDHTKSYAEHQVAGKFAVFKDNVNFINDHNSNHADELGYTVGVNQFADMTLTEYKRTMLGYNALRKPVVTETDLLDGTSTLPLC